MMFCGRLCVPAFEDIMTQFRDETHQSAYSIDPGVIKMYFDLLRQPLMARYEEGCRMICKPMFKCSKG